MTLAVPTFPPQWLNTDLFNETLSYICKTNYDFPDLRFSQYVYIYCNALERKYKSVISDRQSTIIDKMHQIVFCQIPTLQPGHSVTDCTDWAQMLIV